MGATQLGLVCGNALFTTQARTRQGSRQRFTKNVSMPRVPAGVYGCDSVPPEHQRPQLSLKCTRPYAPTRLWYRFTPCKSPMVPIQVPIQAQPCGSQPIPGRCRHQFKTGPVCACVLCSDSLVVYSVVIRQECPLVAHTPTASGTCCNIQLHLPPCKACEPQPVALSNILPHVRGLSSPCCPVAKSQGGLTSAPLLQPYKY